MKNLKTQKDICNKLYIIRGSLKGLGALLQRQACEIPYDRDELSGLGLLFTELSNNLSSIEDDIRTGL